MEENDLRGYIDFVEERAVRGWCCANSGGQPVTVALYVDGRQVSTALADEFRADLREAGIGDGRYGFTLRMPKISAAADPELEVKVVAPSAKSVGVVRALTARISETHAARITDRLSEVFPELLDPADESPDPLRSRRQGRRTSKWHRLLLEPSASLSSNRTSRYSPQPPIFKYLEYTYYRLRKDHELIVGHSASNETRLLAWYLRNYGSARKPDRLPLSREFITYLNEPVTVPECAGWISRAHLLLGTLAAGRALTPELANQPDYEGFVYEWCFLLAPEYGLEDCLVPEYYLDTLSALSPESRGTSFPLSRAMEIYHQRSRDPKKMRLDEWVTRSCLALEFLLNSKDNAVFLLTLPDEARRALFLKKGNGATTIVDLVRRAAGLMGQELDDRHSTALTWGSFRSLLARRGFLAGPDRWLDFDGSGNRIESARFGHWKPSSRCDLQLLGPLEFPSGLSQACRVSAKALEETGFSVNLYDFKLHHSLEKGYSAQVRRGELARSRINLLHLNAELIPLAAAHLPDVFSDSYNIGFFFWELDSPASCHFLALEMLDEIWVASEFGAGCYRPHTSKPVLNMGMAYEPPPAIDVEACRSRLRQSYPIGREDVVFLAAFDSLSFLQRKNPIGAIEAFQAAFPKEADVKLILKIQNPYFVKERKHLDIWRAILEASSMDDRILVNKETLPYPDLLALKAGCDVYVSLHRSEGWGFGMIEAMGLGTPVICTAYSGNMEFCTPDNACLVDFDLVELDRGDYIHVRPGQKWAAPRRESAAAAMRELYERPGLRKEKAAVAMEWIKERFSVGALARRFQARIEQILEGAEAECSRRQARELAAAFPRDGDDV